MLHMFKAVMTLKKKLIYKMFMSLTIRY